MELLFVVLSACALGALLPLERSRHRRRGWVKAAASTGFVATAIAAGAWDSAYGRWVLMALGLGWIGDVALVSAQRTWFLTGLVAFLASHVVYVVAFGVLDIDVVAAIAVGTALAIPATAVAAWLWPRVPEDMRVPVLAYIVVISAMVAAASGAAVAGAPELVVPAAVAFYVSDLFVARDRFVAPGFANRLIGLPLYYAAQLLFAVSTGLI